MKLNRGSIILCKVPMPSEELKEFKLRPVNPAWVKKEGWGASVIPRLSKDIKNELPEIKGFSERNLKRMISFYREYKNLQIVPQSVAQFDNQGYLGSDPNSDPTLTSSSIK